MKFRLYYRGPLKANGDKSEKQRLRRAFLPQLRDLWSQAPLKDVVTSLTQYLPSNATPLTRQVGIFQFQPLVRGDLELVASLDIILMKPEEPGHIITQAGDIDNLLKTLLDALQMPKVDQIPATDQPGEDEVPFYCLLEDDNLITSLSVITDRLLAPASGRNEVLLLVHVMTEFTHQHFTNMINQPQLGQG